MTAVSDLGCYSFHETKNISSGEGGALIVNNPDLVESAEIVREKGTDRSRFLRGQIDKYTWLALGSSYLPSDMVAAICYPSLKKWLRSIVTVSTYGSVIMTPLNAYPNMASVCHTALKTVSRMLICFTCGVLIWKLVQDLFPG